MKAKFTESETKLLPAMSKYNGGDWEGENT